MSDHSRFSTAQRIYFKRRMVDLVNGKMKGRSARHGNRFVDHLRWQPENRKVEIAHQILALARKRAAGEELSFHELMCKLSADEYVALCTIVGISAFIGGEEQSEKILEWVMSRPAEHLYTEIPKPTPQQ